MDEALPVSWLDGGGGGGGGCILLGRLTAAALAEDRSGDSFDFELLSHTFGFLRERPASGGSDCCLLSIPVPVLVPAECGTTPFDWPLIRQYY